MLTRSSAGACRCRRVEYIRVSRSIKLIIHLLLMYKIRKINFFLLQFCDYVIASLIISDICFMIFLFLMVFPSKVVFLLNYLFSNHIG